jgi:predicted nucleic acid-binding protein
MNAPSPGYLVDTNWMVDYLAGVEAYRDRFEELGASNLAVSVITMAELYEGVVHSRDPARAQAALELALGEGVSILGINDEIAQRFGRLRGAFRRRGEMIPDLDLLIAATALPHGVPLCTEDRRHFGRIPDLQLVSIAD